MIRQAASSQWEGVIVFAFSEIRRKKMYLAEKEEDCLLDAIIREKSVVDA